MTLLNTREAAAYLTLKPVTLEAWRCRGGGPVFVKLNKAVRYKQNDLDAFLDSRIRQNTSQVEAAR